MAYEVNGVWKPWRHPDYREPASALQGWWRNTTTDVVIAVLGETETSSGNPAVKVAKYDFNVDSPGSGTVMRTSTLKAEYDQLPADFDPRPSHGSA